MTSHEEDHCHKRPWSAAAAFGGICNVSNGMCGSPSPGSRHAQRPGTATERSSTSPARGLARLLRPASATPVKGNLCQRHGPLARLKAELAELAAGGNVQLQSLQPLSDAASTADAALELQAQVSTKPNHEVKKIVNHADACARQHL
jgi:hypothetical protein